MLSNTDLDTNDALQSNIHLNNEFDEDWEC